VIGAQAIPGPQVALDWVAAAARLMCCHAKVVTVFGQSGVVATISREYQGRSFIRAPTRLIVIRYAPLWLSCTSPTTTIHRLRRWVMMVFIK